MTRSNCVMKRANVTRRSVCAAIVLFVSTPLWPTAAPAAGTPENPVAIVAEVKGTVSVRPRGESSPIAPTFGAPLREGDRVTVGASGKATLLMNDGQLIELGPGSSMKLGKLPESARGASTLGRVARDAGPSSVRWTARRASAEGALLAQSRMRGADDDAVVRQDYPRCGAITTGRPEFRWSVPPGARQFRLSVRSANGMLWAREVTGQSLAYPADEDSLAPGTEWTWELTAYADANEIGTSVATVTVLAPEAHARVRSVLASLDAAAPLSAPARLNLRAAYLFDAGLLHECEASLLELAALPDERQGALRGLAALHLEMGRTARALRESAEADSLGAGAGTSAR